MDFRRWLHRPIVPLLLVLTLIGVVLTAPLYAKEQYNKDRVTYSTTKNTITLKWGEKPSGGYAIAINSLKRQGSNLTVYYALRSPAANEMVTTVITHPQVSAAIPAGKQKILHVSLVRQPWKVASPVQSNVLPSVGSEANLKKLLEEAGVGSNNQRVYMKEARTTMAETTINAPMAAGTAQAKDESASNDFSRTNTQVEGVDEADIVKTDGEYIYQIVDNSVRIIKAYPAASMSAVKTLNFEAGFYPAEIYAEGKRLVVIGNETRNYTVKDSNSPSVSNKMMIMPPYYRYSNYSRVMVYDLTDRQQPKVIRDVELSGNLVASRKIGSAVYLVTNQNFYGVPGDPDFPVPLYRDSNNGSKDINIAYQDIHYFPGCITPNYLLVAGINLDSQEKASVESYLGAGNEVYVSEKNLYVTSAIYTYRTVSKAPVQGGFAPPVIRSAGDNTRIFKFALNQGKVTYNTQGEVPGHVLNQFSMDENQGYFRVATTQETYDNTKGSYSSNNLVILDSSLKIAGKVDNIAPGEKIYSARFLGDRAYMVTFRTVDPFYVIDIKTPSKPRILGALKIPGYSDYLHPYDANHVIGFGKDTIELSSKYEPGQTNAYYLGMKMALFDVTDVNNPKQEFVEIIGDRGTDSELLHNHRALLFSKEKNLIAFPVSLAKVEGSTVDQNNSFPAYGAFTWQGAYVYGLDLKQGFKLKARITHLSNEDYLKAGYNGGDYQKMVQRLLYIKDTLYTLSPAIIKANDLDSFKEVGAISLQK